MITDAATALPSALGGGRLGPASWSNVGVFLAVGVGAIISARRQGYGANAVVAVLVIVGLLIATQLVKLL